MARKIFDCFTTVLVAVLVVAACLLGGVRIFGYTPFTVLSPSMSPEYLPGDLVYAKKTDPEKINVGDVITFIASDGTTLVTHRVDDVDREDRCFYTKGDANESRDTAPVLYENTVGKVGFSVPKLGYVASYLSSASGKYVAVAVLCVIVLLCILPEIFFPKKKDKAKGDAVTGKAE